VSVIVFMGKIPLPPDSIGASFGIPPGGKKYK